ncbi:hypothetical protein CTAYLR_005199 [Chrysophaeum taylorii]|uniref:Sm domain-containing protein n=1 Tax=Chrysophaeum taylorii TaxID=2483200 RepID=A0AAD7UPW2_9STRA|nr:hypothetical protein CTAYLR_005182 [Chrysophaeum taylorii]KAJ8614164.1 hypothetical protein CTAYLR_005199 [Chrysophaeum taylorii]
MSSFEARLFSYYARFNPERAPKVAEIAAKYQGREAELWLKLEKKYGVLDWRCGSFDALAALRTLSPVATVPTLDNISKCRALLPADSEGFEARVKQGAHHAPREVASSSSFSRGRQLLRSIADPMRAGPFSLLLRALDTRVRVLVRALNAIRGTCVGLLKAFDRHMNLVLLDVAETYLRKARRPDNRKPVTRSIPQLFIRGDTVVLVCRESPAGT